MNYLLDTHTIIWFMNGDKSLPSSVKSKIQNINNGCFLSIASIWEIAIKTNLGKLILNGPFKEIIPFLLENNIELLPINFEHLQKLLILELIHRDPFDRIIIAQAIEQHLTILTKDDNFIKYPVNCFW